MRLNGIGADPTWTRFRQVSGFTPSRRQTSMLSISFASVPTVPLPSLPLWKHRPEHPPQQVRRVVRPLVHRHVTVPPEDQMRAPPLGR